MESSFFLIQDVLKTTVILVLLIEYINYYYILFFEIPICFPHQRASIPRRGPWVGELVSQDC